MIHTGVDAFAAEVKRLCAIAITDGQWREFLDVQAPLVNDKNQTLTDCSLTSAQNKRAKIDRLNQNDPRAAPWADTRGVLQGVNTYEHHEGTVRGTTRAERNMLRTVTGTGGAVYQPEHDGGAGHSLRSSGSGMPGSSTLPLDQPGRVNTAAGTQAAKASSAG